MMIQKATAKDAKALYVLEQKVFTPCDYPLSLRAFYYHIQKNLLLKAVDDGTIVGYILLFKIKKTLKIHSIAVIKEFRRQDVGLKLIENALGAYDDKKYHQTALEVRSDNIPAIKLYQKLGFVIKKELPFFYGDGNSAYYMSRSNVLA